MNPLGSVRTGVSASRSVVVTPELTVGHYHSGLPFVYGTPMMIYLMEVAASDALQPFLPEGWVSVGTRVEVQHLSATPLGFHVTATATIEDVDDRGVTFAVEAHDGLELIGRGRHRRAPIELERFERGVRTKEANAPRSP